MEHKPTFRTPAALQQQPVNKIEIDMSKNALLGRNHTPFDRISGRAVAVGDPVDLDHNDYVTFNFRPPEFTTGVARYRLIVMVEGS